MGRGIGRRTRRAVATPSAVVSPSALGEGFSPALVAQIRHELLTSGSAVLNDSVFAEIGRRCGGVPSDVVRELAVIYEIIPADGTDPLKLHSEALRRAALAHNPRTKGPLFPGLQRWREVLGRAGSSLSILPRNWSISGVRVLRPFHERAASAEAKTAQRLQRPKSAIPAEEFSYEAAIDAIEARAQQIIAQLNQLRADGVPSGTLVTLGEFGVLPDGVNWRQLPIARWVARQMDRVAASAQALANETGATIILGQPEYDDPKALSGPERRRSFAEALNVDGSRWNDEVAVASSATVYRAQKTPLRLRKQVLEPGGLRSVFGEDGGVRELGFDAGVFGEWGRLTPGTDSRMVLRDETGKGMLVLLGEELQLLRPSSAETILTEGPLAVLRGGSDCPLTDEQRATIASAAVTAEARLDLNENLLESAVAEGLTLSEIGQIAAIEGGRGQDVWGPEVVAARLEEINRQRLAENPKAEGSLISRHLPIPLPRWSPETLNSDEQIEVQQGDYQVQIVEETLGHRNAARAEQRRQFVSELVGKGYDLRAIAVELGLSEGWTAELLRRYGLNPQKSFSPVQRELAAQARRGWDSLARWVDPAASTRRWQLLQQLASSGMSVMDVALSGETVEGAERLNLRPGWVYALMQRAGLRSLRWHNGIRRVRERWENAHGAGSWRALIDTVAGQALQRSNTLRDPAFWQREEIGSVLWLPDGITSGDSDHAMTLTLENLRRDLADVVGERPLGLIIADDARSAASGVYEMGSDQPLLLSDARDKSEILAVDRQATAFPAPLVRQAAASASDLDTVAERLGVSPQGARYLLDRDRISLNPPKAAEAAPAPAEKAAGKPILVFPRRGGSATDVEDAEPASSVNSARPTPVSRDASPSETTAPPGPRSSMPSADDLRFAIESGVSVAELAERYGCSRSTIYGWLSRRGVLTPDQYRQVFAFSGTPELTRRRIGTFLALGSQRERVEQWLNLPSAASFLDLASSIQPDEWNDITSAIAPNSHDDPRATDATREQLLLKILLERLQANPELFDGAIQIEEERPFGDLTDAEQIASHYNLVELYRRGRNDRLHIKGFLEDETGRFYRLHLKVRDPAQPGTVVELGCPTTDFVPDLAMSHDGSTEEELAVADPEDALTGAADPEDLAEENGPPLDAEAVPSAPMTTPIAVVETAAIDDALPVPPVSGVPNVAAPTLPALNPDPLPGSERLPSDFVPFAEAPREPGRLRSLVARVRQRLSGTLGFSRPVRPAEISRPVYAKAEDGAVQYKTAVPTSLSAAVECTRAAHELRQITIQAENGVRWEVTSLGAARRRLTRRAADENSATSLDFVWDSTAQAWTPRENGETLDARLRQDGPLAIDVAHTAVEREIGDLEARGLGREDLDVDADTLRATWGIPKLIGQRLRVAQRPVDRGRFAFRLKPTSSLPIIEIEDRATGLTRTIDGQSCNCACCCSGGCCPARTAAIQHLTVDTLVADPCIAGQYGAATAILRNIRGDRAYYREGYPDWDLAQQAFQRVKIPEVSVPSGDRAYKVSLRGPDHQLFIDDGQHLTRIDKQWRCELCASNRCRHIEAGWRGLHEVVNALEEKEKQSNASALLATHLRATFGCDRRPHSAPRKEGQRRSVLRSALGSLLRGGTSTKLLAAQSVEVRHGNDQARVTPQDCTCADALLFGRCGHMDLALNTVRQQIQRYQHAAQIMYGLRSESGQRNGAIFQREADRLTRIWQPLMVKLGNEATQGTASGDIWSALTAPESAIPAPVLEFPTPSAA